MFFFLSKALLFLLEPVVWIFSLILFTLFTKNEFRKRRSLRICLLLLFISGNCIVANEAFKQWEIPDVPLASIDTGQIAIVLSGITNPGKYDSEKVFFSTGADRLLHTVQLYHLHKLKAILITGGSSAMSGKTDPESLKLKIAFMYCGVDEHKIFTEYNSRNTHESAENCKPLLDSLFPGTKSFLLITSAFHMRRSLGCFRKAGISVIPYPVHFYAVIKDFRPEMLIPSTSVMSDLALLIHEVIGYLSYKMMGYI